MDKNIKMKDHDLLIRVDTRLGVLSDDIKNLSNDLLLRVIKVEGRLDVIDLYHAKIPLDDYNKAYLWVNKLRDNFRLIIFITTLLSGIAVFLLEKVLATLFHF